MRSSILLLTLSLCLSLATIGCNKAPSDNSGANATNADNSAAGSAKDEKELRKEAKEGKAGGEHKERKREPVVVEAGTAITINLGSALGSKLSQAGQTFTGSVAKDVMAGNTVAIPQGSNVSGTVTDAKALGKFKGGAVLELRLDSVNVNGADLPVQAGVKTFSAKGKGKRTAVLAGGGAALGGIVGALAGGGKGAAIGLAAGGGAGAAGAALTGNKDIVLPSESAVSFELSQALEVKK